jgi:hypothetical protein
MRSLCKSLNHSNNNIGVWVAISTSILFTTPNHPSTHHHSIAATIAAFALIVAAGVIAWLYRSKCNATY